MMMNLKKTSINFICILILFSCAQNKKIDSSNKKDSKEIFSFIDGSGEYRLQREVKLEQNKIVSRTQLYQQNASQLPLEKTISVSQLGRLKGKKGLISRPVAYQTEIWFEKESYKVGGQVDIKTKSLNLTMQSPDEKWKGKKNYPFPPGVIFCFFSQIPECVKNNGLLKKTDKVEIYVIWDNFPYNQAQWKYMEDTPFVLANWEYDGSDNNFLRYSLTLNNQAIFYHFDHQVKFAKMFWVAQEISMIRLQGNE
jgi:hypothetical protein